ncbi:MAG TPA: SMI1/KNR4 family protein [Pirellulales bacterium]
MQAVWSRIEAWFQAHAPEALAEFRPPATNRHINHLEDATDLRLPAEMEQSYKIHDGSWALRMFPGGNLMTIQAIEETWSQWAELADNGAFAGVVSSPDGPIQPVHWSTRWLPLTVNGTGDCYCVDLDPAPGGSPGQIIWFSHETGPLGVVANSFGEWLTQYADDLEAGRYVFSPEVGIAAADAIEPA